MISVEKDTLKAEYKDLLEGNFQPTLLDAIQ